MQKETKQNLIQAPFDTYMIGRCEAKKNMLKLNIGKRVRKQPSNRNI